jgi:hypothetical protein
VAKLNFSNLLRKSPNRKTYLIIGLLFIVLMVVVVLRLKNYAQNPNVLGTSLAQNPPTLQVGWFLPRTSSPVPSSTPANSTPVQPTSPPTQQLACNVDNGIPAAGGGNPFSTSCRCELWLVECRNFQCVRIIKQGPHPVTCAFDAQMGGCRNLTGGRGTGVFCFDKPIIYLYPTEKTIVDVIVTMEKGKVVVSDPLYDEQFKGWQGVEAYPNGKLVYKGKEYKELFYESATTAVTPPKTGLLVQRHELLEKLTELTSNLGLIHHEQQDFLDYWLPELNKLNSPYFMVSLVSKEDKEKTDKVTITPKPDTMIEFLVYFKPLFIPEVISPLQLPSTPIRKGFTAVEWGGTIDF